MPLARPLGGLLGGCFVFLFEPSRAIQLLPLGFLASSASSTHLGRGRGRLRAELGLEG